MGNRLPDSSGFASSFLGKKLIWRFAQFIFADSRMGTLLPWNFFITPYNFWMQKLYINYTEEGIDVNASNADEYVRIFSL